MPEHDAYRGREADVDPRDDRLDPEQEMWADDGGDDDLHPDYMKCGVCGHGYMRPVLADDACPLCFPNRGEE